MYDKNPCLKVSSSASECLTGWSAILGRLRPWAEERKTVVCVECYPGVFTGELARILSEGLRRAVVIRAEECYSDSAEVDLRVREYLTDDPVFGRMNGFEIADFFDPGKLEASRERVRRHEQGVLLVLGTGAALIAEERDVLLYADLARWEIQQRQRRGEIGNLASRNEREAASLKYKRGYFLDWRAADRLKKRLWPAVDFLLDTNDRQTPRMIRGETLRHALQAAVRRPFRVVPYFDPGPWGGHWMELVCDLPHDVPNHAWCFDCVPEENSLLLGFGEARVEIPAINLVFAHPRELLGEAAYARFGAEFPIRFDFLDTMGGRNLSLQVHPLAEYMREKFGMSYTQDESYYVLDAAANGTVYLGLREGIDREAMARELAAAQAGKRRFEAGKYVKRWPVKKHDHFSVPAGTIHCSGRNCVVLEISATPYIFIFNLWDWGRLGLDGRPRPVHLDHGLANIQWDRTAEWVKQNLIGRVTPGARGVDWREERTGLHALEFLETRRHWFSGVTPYVTRGRVNVLNLVQGGEAVVESPSNDFEPFVVHYAETFIVPAAVEQYTIRPHGPAEGTECATIKASVRANR